MAPDAASASRPDDPCGDPFLPGDDAGTGLRACAHRKETFQMKTRLDWRCLAVGFLAGVCLALTMGAKSIEQPQRFQISAQGGGEVWVLDTATGGLWRARRKPDTHTQTYEWVNYGSPSQKPGVLGKNDVGGEITYEKNGIPW